VEYGAIIKFMLAFGAGSNDLFYSQCKPAYSGSVM
jgi:hypothetical protein